LTRKGLRQAYSDFEAGHFQSYEEAFEQLREKHGLPREADLVVVLGIRHGRRTRIGDPH
jgi:hypothetical protein